MGENLKSFVKKMAFSIIFQLQELYNKNGVVKRKKRALEEIARTLLNETNLSKYFWACQHPISFG